MTAEQFPLCLWPRPGPTFRVTLLDLTLPTPAENLALDEALLDLCDAGGPESLRFWESPVPFVVVGYGNRIVTEVNVAACEAAGMPILRRCSGGGTVVQGPGCLNYNLVFRIPEDGPLTTVTGTNRFIMERMRDALQPLVGGKVVVEGHTDLCVEILSSTVLGGASPAPQLPGASARSQVRKFSGNAQRRRRHALVFHGTLLLDFDLSQITKLLNHPSAEPDYRTGRSHLDFVANLALPRAEVRRVIAAAWSASKTLESLPDLTELSMKYASREWNCRS